MKRTGKIIFLVIILISGLLISQSVLSKNFLEVPVLSEAVDYFYFSLVLKLTQGNQKNITPSVSVDDESYSKIASMPNKNFTPTNCKAPCFEVEDDVRCYLFGSEGKSAFYYSINGNEYHNITPLPFYMVGLEAEYHRPTNSIYLMASMGDCEKYTNLSASECLSQFWMYDINEDEYEKMPNLPRGWGVFAPKLLGNCHAEGGASAIFEETHPNRIYHVGGQGRCRRCDYFDVKRKKWHSCSNYPEANGFEGATFGIINNKLYVIGGQSSIHPNHAWVYDPTKDIWKSIEDPPYNTVWSFGGPLNDTLHIIKGCHVDCSNPINIHLVYNSAKNSYKEIAPSPYPKGHAGATGIWRNCLYLFGLKDGSSEKYCQ